MDDELRGITFDHVVYDEIADMTAVQEKAMSDMVDAMMYSYNVWGTVTARIRTCCKCKKIHEQHPWAQDYYDHPFFNNNLEMLEWECQKRKV